MVEFIDESGKPRSDEDLTESINMINSLMLRPPLSLPQLVVLLPCIRQLLQELQRFREILEKAREARAAKEAEEARQ